MFHRRLIFSDTWSRECVRLQRPPRPGGSRTALGPLTCFVWGKRATWWTHGTGDPRRRALSAWRAGAFTTFFGPDFRAGIGADGKAQSAVSSCRARGGWQHSAEAAHPLGLKLPIGSAPTSDRAGPPEGGRGCSHMGWPSTNLAPLAWGRRRTRRCPGARTLRPSLGARTPLSTSTWITPRAGRRRPWQSGARRVFTLLEDSVVFSPSFLAICWMRTCDYG